jgi:hypothetical protein
MTVQQKMAGNLQKLAWFPLLATSNPEKWGTLEFLIQNKN